MASCRLASMAICSDSSKLRIWNCWYEGGLLSPVGACDAGVRPSEEEEEPLRPSGDEACEEGVRGTWEWAVEGLRPCVLGKEGGDCDCDDGEPREWPECDDGEPREWPECDDGEPRKWPECDDGEPREWPEWELERNRSKAGLGTPLLPDRSRSSPS